METPNLYYSIGDFYRRRFGTKIKKVPVSVAEDCPNRRGLKGMETCIFCDVWGSAAYPELRNEELKVQIREKTVSLGARYGAPNFLAYFQSYTNTFLGVRRLREAFETALSFPQVKGIVIGTRPDCLSPAVLNLWKEFQERCFVSVELGIQTFDDRQLEFLKRGHGKDVSLRALETIKRETAVDLGVHLIFGIPEETDSQLVETARTLSRLEVDNVKLHHLHVLKNTPLENLYRRGEFTPVSLEEYARRVALFLRHLSPKIAVQRLAALSSRWDELVAPSWTRHKMETHQFILGFMKKNGFHQGQLFQEE